MNDQSADVMETRYETTVSEEDIIKVSDSHGNVMEFLEYGGQCISARGVKLGRFPNPKTNFPRLKEINIKPEDCFLCAYPKAGTHWTWEIMSMIIQQSAEYHPLKKETHMIEFNTPEVLESVTSPRVFNTHLRPNNMPQQFFQKRCKTVFVQRNPKDVAVSFYYHCIQTTKFPGTFIQFMDFLMEKHGPMYHCAWPLYTLEWEKYFKEHPDHPVHFIMYEDLQQDPVSEIKRLSSFLEKTCDDQLANQIAEKCSFQNLKTASATIKGGNSSSHVMTMYRKGKVGDWKNHFTVALNEEFDQYLKQHKIDSVYKYEI